VRPPPSAELAFDVTRSEAGGAPVSYGNALLSWQIQDGNYKLRLDSGVAMISTRINELSLSSEGAMDDAGIAPASASAKRGGGAEMITRFDRDTDRIVFSGSERSYRINTGSQDRTSLLMQLAGMGAAEPDQIQGEIAIYVGDAADAGIVKFNVVGQEEIASALGKLATWHLSQVAPAGSARLEVWLAPAHNWFPVQMRTTEPDGVATTQLISRIALTAAAAQ